MKDGITEKRTASILYAGNAFYLQFLNENTEDLVFSYADPKDIKNAVRALVETIKRENIYVVNGDTFKFMQDNGIESIMESAEYAEDVELLEFEMFDVKRRDIMSFKDFLKSAGNASDAVESGADLPNRKYQLGFMHEIKRNPLFKHPAFDNLFKSFGERDEKKRKEDEGGNYTRPGAFPAGVGGF